jgi:hypothetical protein
VTCEGLTAKRSRESKAPCFALVVSTSPVLLVLSSTTTQLYHSSACDLSHPKPKKKKTHHLPITLTIFLWRTLHLFNEDHTNTNNYFTSQTKSLPKTEIQITMSVSWWFFYQSIWSWATRCGQRKVEANHKATQKMIRLLQHSIGA